MLQKGKSLLTSVNTSPWKDPEICLFLSEQKQKCTRACVLTHRYLLVLLFLCSCYPGEVCLEKTELGLLGKRIPYPYGKKAVDNWYFSQKAGQRAVNLLLLHPTALRLPANPEAAQVVVWVCLLYFAFGI